MLFYLLDGTLSGGANRKWIEYYDNFITELLLHGSKVT